jgi:hypothetical protein
MKLMRMINDARGEILCGRERMIWNKWKRMKPLVMLLQGNSCRFITEDELSEEEKSAMVNEKMRRIYEESVRTLDDYLDLEWGEWS